MKSIRRILMVCLAAFVLTGVSHGALFNGTYSGTYMDAVIDTVEANSNTWVYDTETYPVFSSWCAINSNVQNLWNFRPGYGDDVNDDGDATIVQANGSTSIAGDCPMIVTTISGLPANKAYDVSVTHISNIEGWGMFAGLTPDTEEMVHCVWGVGIETGNDLGGRKGYEVYVGVGISDDNGEIPVYIEDQGPTTSSPQRTWYDGVVYSLVEGPYLLSESQILGTTDVDVTLTWNASQDTVGSDPVDPDVIKQYVYITSGSATDPNLYYDGEATLNPSDPASSYNLTLDTGTPYEWAVVNVITGYDYTPTVGVSTLDDVDENNLISEVASFETLAVTPESLEISGNVKVHLGGTAEFTVTYASINPVTSVTWYQDDVALTPGGDIGVTFDNTETVLTIANVEAADLGSYYCEATSTPGGVSSPSPSALLVEKKLLARYEFEGDLTDSVGDADATLVGNPMQYVAGIPGLGGLAADPNGTNYGDLGLEAYPNKEYGNGMDGGTISCWIKNTDDTLQVIIGVYNTNGLQGLQIYAPRGIDGSFEHTVRDDLGNTLSSRGPGTDMLDGEWHHIAIAYDGATGLSQQYFDGVQIDEESDSPLESFVDWEHPIALLARDYHGAVDRPYLGQVDDVRLYNYPLTEIEAADLFFEGMPDADDVCILPYGDAFDTNGDCVVDLLDLSALLGHWLDTGLYPQCCP